MQLILRLMQLIPMEELWMNPDETVGKQGELCYNER